MSKLARMFASTAIFALTIFSFTFTVTFTAANAFAANGRGAPTGPSSGDGVGGGSPTCTSSGTSNGSSSIGGMLTQRYDLARTGRDLNETALNRSNIQNAFGLIGRLPVDGQVYAEPLVANDVPVTDSSGTAATKNLVFIATENDSVYAFDISNPTLLSAVPGQYQPFWHVNFVDRCNASMSAGSDATSGTTACQHVGAVARINMWQSMLKARRMQAASTPPDSDGTPMVSEAPVTDIQVNAPNISPTIGVTATPVIDPSTQTIYVTAMTDENGIIYWKLHALSLATGAEQPGSPVVISASYPGAGDNNNGVTESLNGRFTFSPINQLSRAGLVLNNGYVTVAFTSFDDNEPDHGWVFTYRAYSPNCDSDSLQLAGVYVTTPNSGDGTIWQSGMAPAVDTDGSFFFASGNGDPAPQYADANPPDLADSIVRLGFTSANYGTPSASFSILDYFRPYNHVALATNDVDLGAGGVVLLPQSELNSQVPLMVAGGKQGTVYLLNRANLGKDSASSTADTNIVQELVGDIPGGKNYGPGIYGSPAYYNGKIYVGASGDYLRSIPLVSDGSCNLAAGMGNTCLSWAGMQSSSVPIKLRGASPIISASGTATKDAIVWYIDASAYTYAWTPGQNPPTETDGSAILYAFSTDDLSTPLYRSPVTSVSDPNAIQNNDDCADIQVGAAGCAVKFAVPTVQDGMVFVGTDTEVSVFGLYN